MIHRALIASAIAIYAAAKLAQFFIGPLIVAAINVLAWALRLDLSKEAP